MCAQPELCFAPFATSFSSSSFCLFHPTKNPHGENVPTTKGPNRPLRKGIDVLKSAVWIMLGRAAEVFEFFVRRCGFRTFLQISQFCDGCTLQIKHDSAAQNPSFPDFSNGCGMFHLTNHRMFTQDSCSLQINFICSVFWFHKANSECHLRQTDNAELRPHQPEDRWQFCCSVLQGISVALRFHNSLTSAFVCLTHWKMGISFAS